MSICTVDWTAALKGFAAHRELTPSRPGMYTAIQAGLTLRGGNENVGLLAQDVKWLVPERGRGADPHIYFGRLVGPRVIEEAFEELFVKGDSDFVLRWGLSQVVILNLRVLSTGMAITTADFLGGMHVVESVQAYAQDVLQSSE